MSLPCYLPLNLRPDLVVLNSTAVIRYSNLDKESGMSTTLAEMSKTLDYGIYIKEETYVYPSVPCILLSIMAIILNIFVINFYRKSQLTVVPLLYTLIATADIICVIGVTHKYFVALLFLNDYIGERTVDINAMIFYFVIQISCRCSVFCNLILALSRTVMILNPFHRINLKAVKLASFLYTLPWIVLNGININEFKTQYFCIMSDFGNIIGAGLGKKIYENWPDSLDTYIKWYVAIIIPDFIAFVIPVIIVIITCIIKLISLHRSNQFPTSSNQRHVTITVLLMSTLFVLCNTPYSVYFTSLFVFISTNSIDLFNKWTLHHFTLITLLLETLLPVLNAALNPVIIITRSCGMRGMFLESLQRLLMWVKIRRE